MANNHHKNYNQVRDYMRTPCRNNNKGNLLHNPWQFLSGNAFLYI